MFWVLMTFFYLLFLLDYVSYLWICLPVQLSVTYFFVCLVRLMLPLFLISFFIISLFIYVCLHFLFVWIILSFYTLINHFLSSSTITFLFFFLACFLIFIGSYIYFQLLYTHVYFKGYLRALSPTTNPLPSVDVCVVSNLSVNVF